MAKSASKSTLKTRITASGIEPEKAISQLILEIIEYGPDGAVIKTMLKKSTGKMSVMMLDNEEGLTEKNSPFDTYAQLIEGSAAMVINKVASELATGQGIIIPAQSAYYITPKGGFKMILTIVKNANG